MVRERKGRQNNEMITFNLIIENNQINCDPACQADHYIFAERHKITNSKERVKGRTIGSSITLEAISKEMLKRRTIGSSLRKHR